VAAPAANSKIVLVRVVSQGCRAVATSLTTGGWSPAPRGTSLRTMRMPPPVCFILLVHKLPTQVGRLVDAVAPCPVLVHVDARSSPQIWNGFQELAARRPQVELIDRRRTSWASWGAVEALLQALERSQSLHCTHVVHMTGQDYPLRPVDEIVSFLGQGPATSWIPYHKMPVAFLSDRDGGLSRACQWNMPIRTRRARVPVKRRLPEGVAPYYGQAQRVLSMGLVRQLLDLIKERPQLLKFFRRTWTPDELFIPSLAMSLPMEGEVSGANLWFTDWSAGGPHPKVFRTEDIDRLTAVAHGQAGELPGGPIKLFARKFDFEIDAKVVDLVDERLLAGGSARPVSS
jgi:Core-2/I-Branching enzyme